MANEQVNPPSQEPELTVTELIELAQRRNAPLYQRIAENNMATTGTAQYLEQLKERMHPQVALPPDQE